MFLRDATLDDLDLILHWDEQSHVKDPGVMGDPEFNDWDWASQLGRAVAWRKFLIAETADGPIGFIQIIDPETEELHCWGDCGPGLRAIDIWIGMERDTGRGYGCQMMRLALALCFDDVTVKAVVVDPMAENTDAHRFYRGLGFRFVERRFFGPDECCVYRLERAAWRDGG